MKKVILSLLIILLPVGIHAQTTAFPTLYKSTSLRLPSVPLLMNNTYFSYWSPYDHLNDGQVTHWTGKAKPLDGLLRVDGKTYRVMGAERQYVLGDALLPMADVGAWTAPVSYNFQWTTNWAQRTFDDSGWEVQPGAFGSPNEYSHVRTAWEGSNRDIYIRRTMTLTADDLQKDLYIIYSHDDVFELFINGSRVISTGNTWLQGEVYHLTESDKQRLREGDNIIAAHCHNTTGGAYVDFGVFENLKTTRTDFELAAQKSCDVMATSTYYTFTCGPVELDLVFTAPMLMRNLQLLSTPVNYVSFRVRSTDNQQHNVQFYLAATSELCLNDPNQVISSIYLTNNQKRYIRCGKRSQKVLERAGDLLCIDWGYLYIPEVNGTVAVASQLDAESDFNEHGKLESSVLKAANDRLPITSTKSAEHPLMTFVHDFGDVKTANSFAMIGYDETYCMQYNFKNYKAYWAKNPDGTKTIYQAFDEMETNYNSIVRQCYLQDKTIYDDALKSGNKNYAELLSASYRQCIGAHTLFLDEHNHLLFFSKENNSGGFVNTLDVTYPSQPLFLYYNRDLAKGMLTSILEYCESDDWGFNFACHDLGFYPHANGQAYSIRKPNAEGGFDNNMPIEESGNMLTLVATITMLDGNADYALGHWRTLKKWADYLVANGQDPENQLCTDDFAGHLAHNANLSLKAIMGVLAFSEIARYAHEDELSATYLQRAKDMAAQWQRDAVDSRGDHYKLTLDRNDTWSQKYNLVWDYLWDTHIFPTDVMQAEINYYLGKQNKYGLPLDSRDNYTKSDWVIWTASMADDKSTFLQFSDLVWKYANETSSRVPLSDWFRTSDATQVGFKARSVVGGHWMKVLMDNFEKKDPQTTGIIPDEGLRMKDESNNPSSLHSHPSSIYDLQGRKVGQQMNTDMHGVYIKNGKKIIR